MIRFLPIKVLSQAGRVARIFNLGSVTLRELRMSRPRSILELRGRRLKYSTSDKAHGVLSDDGNLLTATVDFRLTAHLYDEAKDRRIPGGPEVSIRAVVVLEYHRQIGEVPVTPEEVAAFARANGPYNAWPYLRELVSSTTARTGLVALTLDSLVVQPELPKGVTGKGSPSS